MGVKFPQRRSDGAFHVDAVFVCDVPLRPGEFDGWLNGWASSNSTWTRHWRGSGDEIRETQVLRLADEFRNPPSIVELESDRIVVRFEGRSDAVYWKDWFVRFVQDAKARFPGLQLAQALDAPPK